MVDKVELDREIFVVALCVQKLEILATLLFLGNQNKGHVCSRQVDTHANQIHTGDESTIVEGEMHNPSLGK